MKDRATILTERLYYEDQKLFDFDAEIIDCVPTKDGKFEITLDGTAFFPEGGGQYGDRGEIGGVRVIDTIERGGVILHICDGALQLGHVHCRIDAKERYSKMQNHSGEHIVSGIVHSLYDADNVGFHLGDDDATLDFNKKLSREELDRVEYLANRATWDDLPIIAYFPSADELSMLEYRSKLDLVENVRIVKIGDIDTCACCAPHVERTGEIGMIKLLDHAAYKGGVRVHMVCGDRALTDYRDKYENTARIAAALSAKQHDAADKFFEFVESMRAAELKIKSLQREIISLKAASVLPDARGNIVLFEQIDPELSIEFANALLGKCENCVFIFSGNDLSGYKFTAASHEFDLTKTAAEIRSQFNGKCGSKPSMIRGSIMATKAEIELFLEKQMKEDI